MNGWSEWLIFSAGMVAAGVGLAAFVFNPPLVLLGGALVAAASWIASGSKRDE